MEDTFLAHYGRKGQKWGEHLFGRDRRGSKNSSSSKDSEKTPASRSGVKKASSKGVTMRLTNEELQERVKRLQLEAQYKQYMDQLSPKKKNRGKQLVDGLLDNVINKTTEGVGDAFKRVTAKYVGENADLFMKNMIEEMRKQRDQAK